MLDSIKKMMDALSAQYAGEYLTASDKDKFLNKVPINNLHLQNLSKDGKQLSSLSQQRKEHIALLCDETTNHKVLNYVLEKSHNTTVDILYHGNQKNSASDSFYTHACSSFMEKQVDVSLVNLIHNSIEDISHYLKCQRALQFLVTDSHDPLIGLFLKNKTLSRHINVPIVLIN